MAPDDNFKAKSSLSGLIPPFRRQTQKPPTNEQERGEGNGEDLEKLNFKIKAAIEQMLKNIEGWMAVPAFNHKAQEEYVINLKALKLIILALKAIHGPVAWDIYHKTLWEKIYDIQDGRCFKCGRPTPLNKTGKHSYSFKILCLDCYEESTSSTLIIIDDLCDYPGEGNNENK